MVLLKTGVSLSIYIYHIEHSYIYFMDRNMFGMNCHEYVKTTEQCVVDKVYAVKSVFLHKDLLGFDSIYIYIIFKEVAYS